MNLYKLATGISTNIKDTKNEKNISKKSSKNILNNIGSKKQKLKIVENKLYDKNKKNEVINKNINYENDNEEIIKKKEEIESLKEKLSQSNLNDNDKKYIKANIKKAENSLIILQNKK